ncbi:hypothetical protein E2C01_062184 [Portunus trituberculatus]|uniref:Uncharacterized protein n=1 Tax=Portunus trituberculatus TaxID=210409 RepID=A0A5B7HEF7_PORTR|nr:hypothetical protein [Portunus trituberculatus]
MRRWDRGCQWRRSHHLTSSPSPLQTPKRIPVMKYIKRAFVKAVVMIIGVMMMMVFLLPISIKTTAICHKI